MKRLEDRKIRVELTDRREGPADRRRLRPDLRRAAAEAGHPAPRARSAGDARAAGRIPRRRSRSASTPRAASSSSKGSTRRCRRESSGAMAQTARSWTLNGRSRSTGSAESARQEAGRPAAGAADRLRLDDVVRPRAAAAAGARPGVLLLARSPARRSPTASSRLPSARARSRKSSSPKTASAAR